MSRSLDDPRLVLVVDDHPLFRAGFVAAWRRWRERDRIHEADSVGSAMTRARSVQYDVAILDLRLPDGSGLDLCHRLTSAALPVCLIILLTTYDGAAIIEASRRLGARGFLSKELAVGELFREIERLLRHADATCFPPTPKLPHMTARELQVLHGLLQGRSNPDIAARMGVGVETVKTYVSTLLGHLGARDRFEAAETARRLGFDVALPHLRDA